MKNIFYLPILLIVIASCATPKALKTFSDSNLVFGSGGGYTNVSNAYTLSYDGLIQKPMSSRRKVKTLVKSQKKNQKNYL